MKLRDFVLKQKQSPLRRRAKNTEAEISALRLGISLRCKKKARNLRASLLNAIKNYSPITSNDTVAKMSLYRRTFAE